MLTHVYIPQEQHISIPGGCISALIKSGLHNLKSASFRPKNYVLKNKGQQVLSITFNHHNFFYT